MKLSKISKSKTNPGHYLWLLPLVTVVFFQNCSDVKFKTDNAPLSEAVDATGNTDNEIPVPTTFKTKNLTFIQDAATQTKSMDLLFVVDSSSSLDQERQQIAQSIQTFVDKIGPSISLNVAVLLGHAHSIKNGVHSTTGHLSGQLYRPTTSNTSPVIGFTVENWNNAMAQLLAQLGNLPSDSKSDGGEMGLLSLQNLTDPNLPYFAKARNQGFFREEAGLTVIFVADENDICANYPAGIARVPDTNFTQGIESELYAEKIYCGPQSSRIVSAEKVVQQLSSIQKTKPLVVTGIIYPGPQPAPSGTENEIGFGYTDAIKLLNFKAVDIGEQIPDGLATIGTMVKEQLQIKTKFEIANDPPNGLVDCKSQIVAKSIDIKVDGIATKFQFDAESCVVQLDAADAGVLNSKIEIKFDYINQ
jgi:hypothetical protein